MERVVLPKYFPAFGANVPGSHNVKLKLVEVTDIVPFEAGRSQDTAEWPQ